MLQPEGYQTKFRHRKAVVGIFQVFAEIKFFQKYINNVRKSNLLVISFKILFSIKIMKLSVYTFRAYTTVCSNNKKRCNSQFGYFFFIFSLSWHTLQTYTLTYLIDSISSSSIHCWKYNTGLLLPVWCLYNDYYFLKGKLYLVLLELLVCWLFVFNKYIFQLHTHS